MKLHRYVDHHRLLIVTKDVISLSISVLLLFRHYISHKITFGAPSSGGVLCSACGAFIIDYLLAKAHALIKLFPFIKSSFSQASNNILVLTVWLKLAEKHCIALINFA